MTPLPSPGIAGQCGKKNSHGAALPAPITQFLSRSICCLFALMVKPIHVYFLYFLHSVISIYVMSSPWCWSNSMPGAGWGKCQTATCIKSHFYPVSTNKVRKSGVLTLCLCIPYIMPPNVKRNFLYISFPQSWTNVQRYCRASYALTQPGAQGHTAAVEVSERGVKVQKLFKCELWCLINLEFMWK